MSAFDGTTALLRVALSGSRNCNMRAHISIPIWQAPMKTTIEISDPLLRDVREIAAHEGVTLRTLVERGRRRVVAETRPDAPFKLRRASFKGRGCRPSFASWDKLRDVAYEDHGALPGRRSGAAPGLVLYLQSALEQNVVARGHAGLGVRISQNEDVIQSAVPIVQSRRVICQPSRCARENCRCPAPRLPGGLGSRLSAIGCR